MKVLLVRNANAKAGVELQIVDENGVVEVKDVVITKDGKCYELPENPSNRKWVSIKKLEDKDELELTAKEPRTNISVAPRKGLEEYLEGDDKELYLMLVEKAKANRDAAHKAPAKTDLEKAKALVEKWTKKVEELEGKGE